MGHSFRGYAGREIALAAIVGSLVVSAAFAGAPSVINYQGKLTTPAGAPVADGSYQMRFSLFAASSGGTALWTEPAAANPPMNVSVLGGVFTVNLGSVVAIPDSVLANDAWLEVNVNGSLLPRVRLVSAPYALRSKLAEGVAAPLSMSASVLTGLIFSGPPFGVINATNSSKSATFPFAPGVGIAGANGEGNWGYLGAVQGCMEPTPAHPTSAISEETPTALSSSARPRATTSGWAHRVPEPGAYRAALAQQGTWGTATTACTALTDPRELMRGTSPGTSL